MTHSSLQHSAQIALLEAIRGIQERFIEDAPPREVFERVLDTLLLLTGSEYGFVGEVEHDATGQPVIRATAMTDVAWDDQSRALFNQMESKGLILGRLDSLYGHVLQTSEVLISNEPDRDSRSCGFPPGHPPMASVVCLPIKLHGALIGVAALANRAGGYEQELVDFLEPLLVTTAHLLRTQRLNEQRREAEQKLLEAKFEADRANQTKTEFLANMSHELRTPMTAILGFTEVLEDPDIPPEERQDALETVRRNGHYLLQLLDDVLDLSKVEAGRMELERTACSPWRITQEVVELLLQRASGKGVGLELVAGSDLPMVITTDPVRFRQVLVNLAGNAIKFTEQGKVTLTMTLCQGDPSTVEVAVADTGIGIPANQVGLVFEPFRQADSGMTRKQGGTGLGLSISRRLAKLMGGDITVSSVEGEGSTFTMSVDTGPIEGMPLMSPEQLGQQAARETKAREKTSKKVCGRVLLVEDGPDNQKLIARIVRKAGADVEIADNGQLGVEAFRAAAAAGEPFDLVLMDMQMPVMDGYAAATTLRNEGVETPIIALTAHAMSGDRERCIRAGCSDYTTKPVKIPEFMAILRRELPQGG